VRLLQIVRSHQVLSRHFADAHHPDSIRGNRLVDERRVHERTGAGRRSLIAFGSYRVMCFKQRL